MSKTLLDDAEIIDDKTGKSTVTPVETVDPPKPPKKTDNTLIWLGVLVLIVVIGIFMYKNLTAKTDGPKPE